MSILLNRFNLPALLTLSLSIGSMLVFTNIETSTARPCRRNCRPGIGKAVSTSGGGGTGRPGLPVTPDPIKDIKIQEKIEIQNTDTLSPQILKVPDSSIKKTR